MTGNVRWHEGQVSKQARRQARTVEGCTVWLTGFSGSGKSTIAHSVEAYLVSQGRAAYTLDGDNLRHGLNADLGFSPDDRAENVRRVGHVARLMADAGIVTLAPLISPYADGRSAVRAAHDEAGLPFHLVWVSTPLEVCESRDTKGLYARARAGEVGEFTGITAPYEVPADAALVLDTSAVTLDDAISAVVRLIG